MLNVCPGVWLIVIAAVHPTFAVVESVGSMRPNVLPVGAGYATEQSVFGVVGFVRSRKVTAAFRMSPRAPSGLSMTVACSGTFAVVDVVPDVKTIDGPAYEASASSCVIKN